MFSLLNVNKVNSRLSVMITPPNGEPLTLALGPMISRRNKEELIPERQYELINAYLDYKGNDFKSMLYQTILEGSYAVEETLYNRGLTNPPIKAIEDVINMFDMHDVKHFIKDIYRVVAPDNLLDSFDPRIESDGLGTRVQTYLKDDYYDLVSITIPIKAVVGLLVKYGDCKDSSIAAIHKEYVLCGLLANHPIMNYPSILKLTEWCKVLIDLNIQNTDTEAVTVIEKQLPTSELPRYLLYTVIIQKLSIAAVVTDNRSRNVITRTYNYIINKLKTKANSGKRITSKEPMSDVDSTNGDKESVIEAYRIVSNITMGTEVEFNWYTEHLNFLCRDLPYEVDHNLLALAIKKNQCFRKMPVAREQVILASYLFKSIIDPRALDYIGIDGIINILSVAFTVYWTHGHKEIAMFINSKQVRSASDVVDINVTPNIRIDPVLKDKLNELFPYHKILGKNKVESVIGESITMLTYNIFRHKWIPNSPEECLESYFGNNVSKVLDNNFKNKLGELIVFLEECNE